MTYGSSNKERKLGLHTVGLKLGANICNILLALHPLTGCASTSKLVSKKVALKKRKTFKI